MTVEEIFAKLNAHMIEGLMFHDKMANLFDFLGMRGYKRCHEWLYIEECCAYRKLNRYYINHHGKLIADAEVGEPDVIPASWYRYERVDVDTGTKRSAVKDAVEKWVDWETSTKQMYEKAYADLMAMGEVTSAMEIGCFAYDADCELKKACRKHLELKAVDYDIDYMMQEQAYIHDKYKDKEHDKP